LAGKTYIKVNGVWKLVKGAYIKIADNWVVLQKSFVKVSGVWKNVWDSNSNAPSVETRPFIRVHSYSSTGYKNVGSQIQMGPRYSSTEDNTPPLTVADGEASPTFLWGRDATWLNAAGAAITREFLWQYQSSNINGAAIVGDAEATGDKLANTYNKIWWYDDGTMWFRDTRVLNNKTGVGLSDPVYITKRPPTVNSFLIENYNTVQKDVPKKVNFSLPFNWYNEINLSESYVEWFTSTDTTNTNKTTIALTNLNRVRGPIYLSTKSYGTANNDIYTDGATYYSARSGYHQAYQYSDNTLLTGSDVYTPTATDMGKRLWARFTYVNSYTKRNSQLLQELDWAGIVSDSPPVGSGNVTFTRDSANYNLSVGSTQVGTWTGTPTSYRYQWYLKEQTAGAAWTWNPILGATSSTFDASSYKPYNNTTGYYQVVPVVWASNSNGESASGYALYNSSGSAITSSAGGLSVANPSLSSVSKVLYKLPSITTFTVTPGIKKITYITDFSADDPAATATMSWTGQATSSTSVVSASTSKTYSPLTAGTYNFTLTITNGGDNAISGSATSTQNSKAVTGPTTYDFEFANVINQGTNAHSSFDNTNTAINPGSTTGRVLAIYPQDMIQGFDPLANGSGYLLYWSNASEYVIQMTGYRYNFAGTAAYQLRYQIRYYKDQAYADIKYVIKGSSLTTAYLPGMYFDGNALGNLYTGTISQGDILRVYFDGSTPEKILTFTEIPQSVFKNAGATYNSSVDDSYTVLTTATDQYIAPTLSITTANVTSQATSISVPFTTGGSDYNNYSYEVKTNNSSGTVVDSGTLKTTASPLSITTGLSASTTYYISVTPYNSLGQAGTASTTTKATTAAAGTFTDLTFKDMYNDGYAALFYTVSDTTTVTGFDVYARRFYTPFLQEQITSSTSYSTSSSGKGYIAIKFAPSSGTLYSGYSDPAYKWTAYMTPKNGSTSGSTQYVYNMTSQNPAGDLPAATLGTATVDDGSLGCTVTLSNGATYYDAVIYKGTDTSPTASKTMQTGDVSFTGLTNGSSYTLYVTPYYIYWNDPNRVGTAVGSTVRFPGTQKNISGTPKQPGPQAFTINTVTKTDTSAATVTFNDPTYTESTKTVAFNGFSGATKYRTIAYGTAYSPDSVQATPSKGPYYTTGTSDSWSYDEAGSVTVGVGGTDGLAKANVSWGASTNAGSYKVAYTLAGIAYTSPAQTSTSFSVNTYSSGTQQEFILTSVTAYKTTDGTGTDTATGTMPSAANSKVTPTETYSSYTTKSITVTVAPPPFVAPYWNGTLPGWTAASNFQRITTGTANFRWGWANGTFSFAGDVGTSKGWNWQVHNTTNGTTSTGIYAESYKSYTTTNDSRATVQSTSRPYLVWSGNTTATINTRDLPYATASKLGRVNPYQYGTDSVEYNVNVNGTRVWTGYI
jgi:hypothetical protein